ncbi:mechanosensitive ion channel family protein [Malonomonas rubra]|uniref:mechanosensitive ion channel family protein n=1 Tax=Malonomonas rubra TaxID=57040 RepID=UPI0026EAF69E|nr:mechanosensitive ion channel family protein [Malonomonas rubra]
MFKSWIENWLTQFGVTTDLAGELTTISTIILLVLCTFLVYRLFRDYLVNLALRVTQKTSNRWDDGLLEYRVIQRALRLIPFTFIYLAIERLAPDQYTLLKRILFAVIILVAARAVESFFNTVSGIYHTDSGPQRRPIRPLFQALVIVLYLFAGIFIISVLMDKSPWNLFGLMGGLTAVTMLVFKDTILGFVAGIQLGANDMVREGDWIEMPKYGADGDVIEVAVNTVKVQNWDKTITTIPTYALISDSFKNWRGMSESTGRRIKRSICIDMNSVKFADEKMLAKFKKMELLKEYVQKTQEVIDSSNTEKNIDLSAATVNGRRQTNLGIFRAYLVNYLSDKPIINKDMTFLVRHLQPTPQGLPIEIYVFSSDKNWVNYERIQADIFDHILAAIPEFNLRVFQYPSGMDFTKLR